MGGTVRQGKRDHGQPVVAGHELGEPGDVDHLILSFCAREGVVRRRCGRPSTPDQSPVRPLRYESRS